MIMMWMMMYLVSHLRFAHYWCKRMPKTKSPFFEKVAQIIFIGMLWYFSMLIHNFSVLFDYIERTICTSLPLSPLPLLLLLPPSPPSSHKLQMCVSSSFSSCYSLSSTLLFSANSNRNKEIEDDCVHRRHCSFQMEFDSKLFCSFSLWFQSI